MKKYQIYTIIALALMTVCFTIPVLGFFGAKAKIAAGEPLAGYSYKIYDLYTSFQYKNHLMSKDVASSLEKMIEQKAEIGTPSFPIWYVALEAPNYPKDAFPDINHYIGMYPMEHGGNVERAIAPYYLLISTLCMLAFLYYDGKFNSLLMVLPTIAPLLFMGAFAGWLYWYGHNMQEWGAFKIKPFMPTVLGDGKVAQFTTHSYPSIGFWVMMAMSALCILAVFSKKKELKDAK